MEYTYSEVHEAYIKLKTYIYYDSTNLFMRKQLAVFETNLTDDDEFLNRLSEYNGFRKAYDINIDEGENLTLYERKLKVFTSALNLFHEVPEYFNIFLNRIQFKFLPKKIEDEKKESKIITNKRAFEKYNIERSSVFIDAPIEIHLISVLWILKKGVELDKELFEGCFGNRLILNKQKDKVVQGSALFKPYPKQYQKWRDDAVDVARNHLEKDKKSVLILNLDIKDFFYSVRIPCEDINNSPYSNRKTFRSINNLFEIFGKIHEVFTRILIKTNTPYDFNSEVTDGNNNITHYILPIGLLSSFILANHYLIEFDNRIIKNAKPIYYGRYVDDILMVISNPILPKEHVDDSINELNFDFKKYIGWLREPNNYHDQHEELTEDNYEKLFDLEQFVLKNFYPSVTLIDKPKFISSLEITKNDKERVFKLVGFKRLYCQSGKTLLYYFDKDESSMVIDKLKRDLEEKSSEFRNYNDAEDAGDFEESAYHLLYDGTEGKIRTLKDYKEDKFGLSVYLSKRIFNSLRKADKISDNEVEKIILFFKGCNTLNLYTLWERIFVFLLVNKKPDAYVQFYLNCCKAIKLIVISKQISVIDKELYQKNVLEYLDCANELALALHPKFLSEVKKVKRTYHFSVNALKNDLKLFSERYSPTDENSYFISRFRKSNLVRHHYVAQPLLNYNLIPASDFKNFTELKIPF